jgi:dephospho-CoA kinase
MKIIGLTGGIGSGKTTIAKMFEVLGVPVYYADCEAKKIMQSSGIIKDKLVELFGEKSYENEVLNQSFIANIVFKDKNKLNKLNKIVHPEVNKHFMDWVKKQNAAYVIQENAIIFENNNQDEFDFIITVTAPQKIKIERVISRDKTSKGLVLARMKNQLVDSLKIKNSDFVINNTDLRLSKNQVIRIHKDLLQKIS